MTFAEEAGRCAPKHADRDNCLDVSRPKREASRQLFVLLALKEAANCKSWDGAAATSFLNTTSPLHDDC